MPDKSLRAGISMNWQDQVASQYERTIACKISGYELMHHNMERMLAGFADEQAREAASLRLLAVGAGGGYELSLIGKRQPAWLITGNDPSPTMLEAARRRVVEYRFEDRVELIEGQVADLPEGPVFDAAICMLVLHFVQGNEAKRKLLKEIASRLQSGGMLLLAAICGDVHSDAFPIQMAGWKQHMLHAGLTLEDWERFAGSVGTQSDILPSREVEQLLKEAGFHAISRFFGSFLIEGFCAIQGANKKDER